MNLTALAVEDLPVLHRFPGGPAHDVEELAMQPAPSLGAWQVSQGREEFGVQDDRPEEVERETQGPELYKRSRITGLRREQYVGEVCN